MGDEILSPGNCIIIIIISRGGGLSGALTCTCRHLNRSRKEEDQIETNELVLNLIMSISVHFCPLVNVVCFVWQSRFSYKLLDRVGVVIDTHPAEAQTFWSLMILTLCSPVQDHAEMNAPPVLRPLRAILQRRLVGSCNTNRIEGRDEC